MTFFIGVITEQSCLDKAISKYKGFKNEYSVLLICGIQKYEQVDKKARVINETPSLIVTSANTSSVRKKSFMQAIHPQTPPVFFLQ